MAERAGADIETGGERDRYIDREAERTRDGLGEVS